MGAGLVDKVALTMRTVAMRMFITTLFAASFLAATVGCSAADNHETTMTKEQIDVFIAKELPKGSSRSTVIAFLEKQKIAYADHATSGDPTSVGAIFRNISGSSVIVKTAVHVNFVFRDNRLESYSLSEQFTGP
jgi:hypothetical protein